MGNFEKQTILMIKIIKYMFDIVGGQPQCCQQFLEHFPVDQGIFTLCIVHNLIIYARSFLWQIKLYNNSSTKGQIITL